MQTAAPDGPIAVIASDIHLCHKAPIARSAETDWYGAMRRTLGQVADIARKYDVPIIYPGDIFDDGWRVNRCPPELINFAIKFLPKGYAVPGQHDLPHHNYSDLHKSAYWTLVEAGVLTHLYYGSPEPVVRRDIKLVLHGFPWGKPIEPLKVVKESGTFFRLAVIHAYVWKTGHEHPGAKEEQHVKTYKKLLEGFDAAVFGDNHSGFIAQNKGVPILNCGTLMRRRIDEKDYQPNVGLLHQNGYFERIPLDCTADKFIEGDTPSQQLIERLVDIEALFNEINSIIDTSLDFYDVIRKFVEKDDLKQTVRDIIIAIIEKKQNGHR